MDIERLEWAIAVISQDDEDDTIGNAAKIVLAEMLRLRAITQDKSSPIGLMVSGEISRRE